MEPTPIAGSFSQPPDTQPWLSVRILCLETCILISLEKVVEPTSHSQVYKDDHEFLGKRLTDAPAEYYGWLPAPIPVWVLVPAHSWRFFSTFGLGGVGLGSVLRFFISYKPEVKPGDAGQEDLGGAPLSLF